MESDRPFRHELKYLMNRRDMDCCLGRITEFAKPDPHVKDGKYSVRSLYFDDIAKSAFIDKESGVASRHKFRIRIYNMDESHISLEKKIKEGAYIRKESAMLSRIEYDMIMIGQSDFLLKREEEAARDFAAEVRTKGLHPEVIVDYERIPFVSKAGDVRITFDMNVRSVFDVLDVFSDKAPGYEVLMQDQLIMEVKYTQFLPQIFPALLPPEVAPTSASKYVMCMVKKGSIR